VDVGALLSLGRTVRVAAGTQPKALHHFWLQEMDHAVGEAAYVTPGRHDYLFFPGCQLSSSMPEAVWQAAEWLSTRADTGIFLGCCGAPAHWAGEAERMKENVARIRAAWEAAGKPTFVFACASCQKLFAAFLPEISRVSLYSLLAEEGGPVPAKKYEAASVFDPCAARDFAEMGEGVRVLAERGGVALEELREKYRCCGYGGQMKTANPKLFDEITANRIALSEKPYLVYCANCREVFRERDKACLHILELLFGPCDRDWSIQEKRDNQLLVKGRLMREMLDREFCPPARPWDGLELRIAPEVRWDMEEQLISDEDVKECIFASLQSGGRFTDEAGAFLCCLRRKVMTYWVEYRETEGACEIVSAYCHRMQFDTEEKA
jgi:hypothetical protein